MIYKNKYAVWPRRYNLEMETYILFINVTIISI